MTTEEAVAALDAIYPGEDVAYYADNEAAHGDADDVLLQAVPADVRQAWERVRDRVGGFWYA